MTAGRAPGGAAREIAVLLAVTATQMVVVVAVPSPWGALVPLGGMAAALGTGVRMRRVRRTIQAILLITLPVLIVRLLSIPSIDTVLGWADYAGRLLAAGLIAVSYLAARGVRGVQRALSTLVALLPGAPGRAAADVVRSALFLLPEITRRLTGSHAAARIRHRRGRSVSPGATAIAVTRATLVSVSTVPRRRAEAMVVRRIIQ
jgi:hypothetical protein